jgi:hypothetical protein
VIVCPLKVGKSSVLRAERSAATLLFARNTGGQICLTLQSETMGEEGFELVKETTGNTVISIVCNAECDADAAGWHIPAHDDPDLQKLIRLWSALPVEIRAGIMLITSSCKSS